MSLVKPDGTYVVVENATPTQVTIRVHADADHRTRYKSGTETAFETTRGETREVAVDLTVNADAEKSIHDNKITAAYVALKTLEEFTDATDA